MSSNESLNTLLLLRHAQAVDGLPGHPDSERPLTELGQRQAHGVGEFLRSSDISVDLIICSPAVRTRQTCEALGLAAPIQIEPMIYNAGSDTIAERVREVAPENATVLVVGHAPGIPALAYDLADPNTSDTGARALLDRGYPPATLVRLTSNQAWAEMTTWQLVQTRWAD